MPHHNCPTCKLRARYDRAPKSLVGRLWRWHIRFCPGWRAYMKSLPAEERAAIERTYSITPRN